MVWTGKLHECGGVLQGWHISARYGLQGWVYPAGALGARLNHELVRMRGFDGHHGWWEGEPRTGVRGCVGPALRPAASMRHTRALPCPARLSARSAAARAFQPEICTLRPGQRGIAAPGRLVKALFSRLPAGVRQTVRSYAKPQRKTHGAVVSGQWCSQAVVLTAV